MGLVWSGVSYFVILIKGLGIYFGDLLKRVVENLVVSELEQHYRVSEILGLRIRILGHKIGGFVL